MTPFPRRCQILAGLWQHHRNNRNLSGFVETNDLGLPLAFSVYEGLAVPTAETARIINRTWDAFVALCSDETNESDLLVNLRLVLVLSKELPSDGLTEGERTMFTNWLDTLDVAPDAAERTANA